VPFVINSLTPYRLEARSLSPSEFDPQSIWTASYSTSSSKIQQLYCLTQKLAQPPYQKDAEDRSVCITYGGWANRSIYEATAWFIRDLQTAPSEALEHPQPSAGTQDKVGNVAKKRKIRTGKQIDVGCLLGAFR
jgi:hypothetical protein